MPDPRTMYDKVWAAHEVVPETEDAPAVLAIDLHLVHEVTSPQAFATVDERGLRVRDTARTIATMDHSTPTVRDPSGIGLAILDDKAETQLEALRENCDRHGVELHGVGSNERGIVHVMGPELGATHPGMTVVCGDSHTSTHGAFGCLAFGIGTSEVAQVLATQCLLQRRSRSMAVGFEGTPSDAATAKDIALAMIASLGVSAGTGHVFEYRGGAVSSLGMEGRMTLCNMSIEAGARAGMIAPDDTTFTWLEGRPRVPAGAAWERAIDAWRCLATDDGAPFDRVATVDVEGLGPMITWGTTPAMAGPIDSRIPPPTTAAEQQALRYTGVDAGIDLRGIPIDLVFIGSCTNSRLSDLRAAASILQGRSVARGVRALVVPGSERVKAAAEAEGLDRVFIDAGCEWREPGCSMCIAMNGDKAGPALRVVSTSNRNFEGRQGPGSRTMLASPLTAAASAVMGCTADPRTLMREPAIA